MVLTQPLLVGLVVASTFSEGDDVIADSRACVRPVLQTLDAPRGTREEAGASTLQLAAADARNSGLLRIRNGWLPGAPGGDLVGREVTVEPSACAAGTGGRHRHQTVTISPLVMKPCQWVSSTLFCSASFQRPV